MSDKVLRVVISVEEFALNEEESAFEHSETSFQHVSDFSNASVYEALIRGTDAALTEYRGGQKK